MSEFLYGLDPYGNIVVTDTANNSVVFEGIGDNSSVATGISGDGFTVVGYDAAGRTEAFSWTASTGKVGLGYLPYGLLSQASGTNSDGSVVVGMSYYGSPSVTDYAYQAFRSVDGTMTGLGFLAPGTGGGESVANAVSGDGSVVVGWTENGDRYEAFRWTATAGMVGLGYLPGDYRSIATGVSGDGSVVVGTCYGSFTQAFIWTASTSMVGLGYLPGGSSSTASAISADGTVIVGSATDAGGNSEAVEWSSGTITVLGSFAPTAVDANGSVVVGTGTGAVRWTAATGTQSIQSILTADGVNLSGWELDGATGVSADGTVIVGNGNQPWIATIPVNAFALLDLKGVDHSIGSLVWGGTVTNSGANAATLTAGSDNTSTTFIGVIQDGTSTTTLAKAGTGTLTLTGMSTYTGGTMLYSGTLDVAALGAAGVGPITFETGKQILQIENAALSANTFGDIIDSFGRGDVIDLSGLVFHAGAIATYDLNSHILTVTSNGVTDKLILTNPGGTAFDAVSDGASGTKIVLNAPLPVIASEVLSKSGHVTLTGTTGEANDTIAVFDGTALLGTTTTASDGTWSFPTGKVSNVVHTYTATATDFAGNVGHSINEAILGSTHADSLVGTSGNDIINGNGGNDTITGGLGADTLTGGSGGVTFVYNSSSDSTPSSHDTITDFNASRDIINFTNIAGINAHNGTATFEGKLTGPGNLTLNAHSVAYIEVNGNTEVLVNTTSTAETVTGANVSAANMEIVLVGIHLGLKSADFHHV